MWDVSNAGVAEVWANAHNLAFLHASHEPPPMKIESNNEARMAMSSQMPMAVKTVEMILSIPGEPSWTLCDQETLARQPRKLKRRL